MVLLVQDPAQLHALFNIGRVPAFARGLNPIDPHPYIIRAPLFFNNGFVDSRLVQYFAKQCVACEHIYIYINFSSSNARLITPMPTSEPKEFQRTNSGSVIVFDLATQTITTKKAKKLKGMCFDHYVLSSAYHEL